MTDLFNGVWTIDLNQSLVWDDALGRHVPDEVGEEVITLRTEDRTQRYEVLYGDDPKIKMTYTAVYDSAGWVPYVVEAITSSSRDEQQAIVQFKQRIKATGVDRDRHFELGKPYGLVRVVQVDEQTQYRVNKSPDGSAAQSILTRRLSDDGASFLSTVLDTRGIVHRIRRFVRLR